MCEELRRVVILRHRGHATKYALLVIVRYGQNFVLPLLPPACIFRDAMGINPSEELRVGILPRALSGLGTVVDVCGKLSTRSLR